MYFKVELFLNLSHWTVGLFFTESGMKDLGETKLVKFFT